MPSDQEFEAMDYEFGCASELANAFAQSKNEVIITNDTGKINELVAAGKHVVASSGPVYCPRTDACIGHAVHIEGIYDDRGSAMRHFESLGDISGDIDVWVAPIVQPEPLPIRGIVDIFLADDSPF